MKLSVIIPIYNTEPFLRQCIDSIINQTLKDIEIICVNDGSTDNSLAILKEYAAQDHRITIINNENAGQGVARNIALEKAKGEYIGFIDSDDWVDPNMYEELYNSAKSFSTDVTLCEFKIYDSLTGLISYPAWTKIPINAKFDNRSFNWADTLESLFLINSAPWNKIYKRDFILKNNITFAISLNYQDVLFVYKSLIYAEKINLVRKPFYTYRFLRPGSITMDKGKKQFDIFIVLEQLQKNIEENGKYEDLKNEFSTYKFNQFLFHFSQVEAKYKIEFWDKIVLEFNLFDAKIKEHILTLHPKYQVGIEKGFLFFNNPEENLEYIILKEL